MTPMVEAEAVPLAVPIARAALEHLVPDGPPPLVADDDVEVGPPVSCSHDDAATAMRARVLEQDVEDLDHGAGHHVGGNGSVAS